MTKGGDLVGILVTFYKRDMDDLLTTYKKFEEIDGALLKEVVKVEDIKALLKEKFQG